MGSYKILPLESGGYVIVATSYLRPFDDIDHIEYDLKGYDYHGGVLFDLLLCNGLSTNRYMKMDFDGEKFDYDSLVLLKNISGSTKEAIGDFFKENDSYLDDSILPNAQRYLIRCGKAI
ncbi:MAG: type II toxin-antitoxin system RnlB family antitoxin [Clostridiales bacterium]|nr:type II toxin-antitoxin system RnlB family antitoxin [Clostridiales bacterium]